MTTHPVMACGHAANAESRGAPCCAICVGINPGASVIGTQPDLTGRMAKCYCGRTAPSDAERLAFFEYRKAKPHDRFYCGCGGWD